MAHLTLAGLSDDGKRLLLVSDKGVEFTLDIDARLRAALRGDHARLGTLEIQMDSALRPRDIQARIRAGDTPEAVAQAAQTTVDRIMAFAAPVLAERQHVAERAQRSSVRRKPGESSSSAARTLGDAVAGHLRSLNVDPDTVAWDARRREDGRWTLTGDYAAPKRQGSATFIYDPPGNYVTVEDEDARWLLGEQIASSRPPARDDLKAARGRRLSAVSESTQPHEELPLDSSSSDSATPDSSALGDDAIEMVTQESGSLGAEQPVEAYLDDERPTRETPSVKDDPVAPAEPELEPAAEEEEPSPRKTAKRKGRASVPSWDEIMFGGGKNE
jgi:Protein of unknown function (DUF3071)